MKGENISLAMLVASKAGAGTALVSTSELAVMSGFSQQSISRKLRELESEGLIERKPSTLGVEVALTQKGRLELESLRLELGSLLGNTKSVLKGKVVEGHGEGSYYTSIPQYKRQFKELFGFVVFPGTLNLAVDSAARAAFCSGAPIKVEGFSTKARTFGGIDCWPCKVNGKINAVAILPHRTNHPLNVLELIAPVSLRKKLGLENGATVELVRE